MGTVPTEQDTAGTPSIRSKEGSFLDICRVCRGEATSEQPLFYPCLCSGSINLVEWLKHSKKKLCELCKHPFSFSPIYKEQMPERLPLKIIAKGMLKQLTTLAKNLLQSIYLAAVWGLFVPVSTAASFYLYFGWEMRGLNDGSWLVMLSNVCFGLAITVGTIFLTLGLLLLRDYMITHRLLRVGRRQRNRGVDAEPAATIASPLATTQNSQFESETAFSETTAGTVQSQRTEKSSWLQKVTPREYRGFLRRKELYRERFGRQNIRPKISGDLQSSAGVETNIECAITFSNTPVEGVFPEAVLQNDTPKIQTYDSPGAQELSENGSACQASSSFNRDSGRGENMSHFSGSKTKGVLFRESIRCRICSSVTCTSREHVVLASKNFSATEEQAPSSPTSLARERPEMIFLLGNAFESSHVNRRQEQIVEQNAGNSEPFPDADNNVQGAPEEDWILFGMNIEGDHNAVISITEFLGIQRLSIWPVFQNALLVIALNIMVLFLSVFIPQALGKVILKGQILKQTVLILQDLGHLTVTRLETTTHSRYLMDLMFDLTCHVTSLTGVLFGWLKGRIPMELYKVFTNLSTVLIGYLQIIAKVFRFSSSPVSEFFMQITVGYLALIGLCSGYKFFALSNAKALGNFHSSLFHLFSIIGAFLKLFTILCIELLIFPTYCGWVVDLSVLLLFDSTFLQRVDFYYSSPFASSLIHWTIGTVVLVQTAFFVKWCRGSFRPGLLYFIRNSEDPNNLPLKEMVERPLHLQLIRFLNSIVIYAFVLAIHTAGFAIICKALVPNLVPLHFSFRNMASEVPFDLIGQLFAKYIVDLLNPNAIGDVTLSFMRRVIKKLRLSSYFFGGRYLNEEYFSHGARWVFVPDFDRIYDVEQTSAMFKRPVEPLDIAAIPIVEGKESVHVAKQPLGFTHYETLLPRRPRSTGASRRTVDRVKGFTVVFRPASFRTRVFLFLASLWVYFQILGLILFAAPIIVGRFVFSRFMPVGMRAHEMYTFGVGFLIMGTFLKLSQLLLTRMRMLRFKHLYFSMLTLPAVLAKVLLALFMLTVAWPLIIGCYIMMVLSPLLSSLNETPIIPIVTCWSIGIMYTKLFYEGRSIFCSTERRQVIDRLTTIDGWLNMEFSQLCTLLLIPYTTRLCVMVLGPPAVVLIFCPLIDLNFVQILILQRWSYMLSLFVPAIVVGASLMVNLRRYLMLLIRDETYLIGRRLHNLERSSLGSPTSMHVNSPTLALSQEKSQ